jgi:riboflavin transporter FmnP
VDFFLFLLLNFTLFVRPTDFLEGYETLQVYNYIMLPLLLLSIPKIINQFQPQRLLRTPITVFVLGLLPAITLSCVRNLSGFAMSGVWGATVGFAKVVAYYLVFISVVNSMKRLRSLLYATAMFATATAVIAMLDYYSVVEIPALEVLKQSDNEDIDPVTGERLYVLRLRATGLFNDPNDLSMISVFSIVICTMGVCDRSLGMKRFALLVPMGVLFATLVLTKSRGGMLAFLAAAGVLTYIRLGFWKTAALGFPGLIALVVMIGGRGTNISEGMSQTGLSRVQLWSDGLVAMRASPTFGIGFGKYAEEVGQVAHNSFVECFVELGLIGGAIFMGAFWSSVWSQWKLRDRKNPMLQLFANDSFRRIPPFLLAGAFGFAISQLSISRMYVLPTYLVFGACNVCTLESLKLGIPPVIEINQRLFRQLALVSIVFLVGVNLFIRASR